METEMVRRQIKVLEDQLKLQNERWCYFMSQRVEYENRAKKIPLKDYYSDVIMGYQTDITIVEATISSLKAQISALEQLL